MPFYDYSVNAAGSFGPGTEYIGAKTDRPILISKLHYEFHYWPEDDMQCWLGYFIGTDRFKKALEDLSPPVTGVEFDKVEISGDADEFERVWRKARPDSELGSWHWFKITGKPGVDDFAQRKPDLVVSERVAQLLRSFGMNYGELKECDDEPLR
ncbi:MAG: hypothetical protein JST44_18450 [Cyanobacteria bacterium SZAS LIN-5]|nr:hypothetical protein [Cyanobacteria bacterium SZAS LIN-5]